MYMDDKERKLQEKLRFAGEKIPSMVTSGTGTNDTPMTLIRDI